MSAGRWASLLITASLHAAHLNTNQTPHMSPWLVAILTAWCTEPPLYVIFAGSQGPAFVMFPVHCLFCCCSPPRLPLGDTCRQCRWRPRTLDTLDQTNTLFVSGVTWITRKNIFKNCKKIFQLLGVNIQYQSSGSQVNTLPRSTAQDG